MQYRSYSIEPCFYHQSHPQLGIVFALAPSLHSFQEEQPHAQGVVAVRAQEGLEEPSHVEGQEGRWEEIPLIQGKEWRLCFAGAAMKRYPMSKVRETQVRR